MGQEMRVLKHVSVLLVVLLVVIVKGFSEDPRDRRSPDTLDANNAAGISHAERGTFVKKTDPCAEIGIEPNAAAPSWDSPAATTQCGALEIDSLLLAEPLGEGVLQRTIGTTARFGVTPRFEVRWGLPGHIVQNGYGHTRLTGTTDQWFGTCFRFHEQMEGIPDLAIDYAIKIPTANPAKGFGSGYADHVVTLIASEDRGNNHVDFNAVGTVAGGRRGSNGAAQFGMAMTRHFARELLGTIETYGGSQPGTSARYGAVLAGGAWAVRPWLAMNGAYTRAYTAASPRQQIFAGFIYTTRPGVAHPGQ
jgi:hypothetical protein